MLLTSLVEQNEAHVSWLLLTKCKNRKKFLHQSSPTFESKHQDSAGLEENKKVYRNDKVSCLIIDYRC